MFNNKYFKYKKKYFELKGRGIPNIPINIDDLHLRFFNSNPLVSTFPYRFRFFYLNNKLENHDPEDAIAFNNPNNFNYYIDIHTNRTNCLDNNNNPDPTIFIQFSQSTQNDITDPHLKKILLIKVIDDIMNFIFYNSNYTEVCKVRLSEMINEYILATYDPNVIDVNIISKRWHINPKLYSLI